MCEYCKVDENNEDCADTLICETAHLNDNVRVTTVNGSIELSGEYQRDIEVATKIHGVTGELFTMIWIDESPATLDFEKSIKINYCPMCGRKLDA